jgi:hypothetical protein
MNLAARITAVLSSALLLCEGARANTFCVGTAAQLLSALNSSFGGAATDIRVRTGSYNFVASGSSAAIVVQETADLTVSGGWNSNCTAVTASNPDQTILNADFSGRLMDVTVLNASTFTVTGLSFRGGTTTGNRAGCLTVETEVGSSAQIYVDRNSFRLCQTGTSGLTSGLLVLGRSATVWVRGNVAMDNSGSDGSIRLSGLGNAVYNTSNNTVINNFTSVGGTPGVVLSGQSSDFHRFSNNLLRNNRFATERRDLVIFAPAGIVNHNAYEVLLDMSQTMVINQTISADPLFVSATNPRLRPDSPLRDTGGVVSGGTLAVDFDGAARVQGTVIDRGAFEISEFIFRDGFQ